MNEEDDANEKDEENNEFACQFCSKTFTTERGLKKHVEYHCKKKDVGISTKLFI